MAANKETVQKGIYYQLKDSPVLLDDATRAQRAAAAEQSFANARLEGFEPTAEDLKANQLWVDGKLSTEDLVNLHKERFRTAKQHG